MANSETKTGSHFSVFAGLDPNRLEEGLVVVMIQDLPDGTRWIHYWDPDLADGLAADICQAVRALKTLGDVPDEVLDA